MARRRRRPSLRRRPTNRQIVVAIVTLIALLASFADRHLRHRGPTSGPVAAGDDRSRYDRRVGTVRHVVDGDTLDVDCDGETVRVRLLGIDAPEATGPAADLGRQAAGYLNARAAGQRVTLRLEELSRPRDRYQRLLAYVYRGEGELINDSIVRDGWAFAHREFPCDFSGQLEASEAQARSARRGMWRTITLEQMPAWRKKWMAERGLK